VAPVWAPEITLTRLDCGTPIGAAADLGFNFSDNFGDNAPNIRLVLSRYLIKHGDDYMIWDAGFGMGASRVAPKTSLVDLLAQVTVTPEQIKYVRLSHYHTDHVGQVNLFPEATLPIGKGDSDILSGPMLPPSVRRPPGDVVNAQTFVNWISGGGKVEPSQGCVRRWHRDYVERTWAYASVRRFQLLPVAGYRRLWHRHPGGGAARGDGFDDACGARGMRMAG
jgi:hypothetical protein